MKKMEKKQSWEGRRLAWKKSVSGRCQMAKATLLGQHHLKDSSMLRRVGVQRGPAVLVSSSVRLWCEWFAANSGLDRINLCPLEQGA